MFIQSGKLDNAIFLNKPQRDRIQDAVDALSEGDNWEPVYRVVVEILDEALETEGMVAPEDRAYVDAVHVWFKGAVLVNTRQGAFSELIRSYTKRQFNPCLGFADSKLIYK